MKEFRFWTPLAVSVLGILVSILMWMVNNLNNRFERLEAEIQASQKFSIEYTNKLVDLTLKVAEKRR